MFRFLKYLFRPCKHINKKTRVWKDGGNMTWVEITCFDCGLQKVGHVVETYVEPKNIMCG